ncbi:RadC family protein [Shewanella algae]|uniref:RadC family protein n=1 Tax=Shewanella algae TaxID=38313 RepID=UPI0004682028|nr:DNA repair protein RadC [Shewanella algae]
MQLTMKPAASNEGNGEYQERVIREAISILESRYQDHNVKTAVFTSPPLVKDYLMLRMAGYEREVFAVLLLDSQHRLIACEELFFGTIDAAAVYPREVVKLTLSRNAAAVIFAHNHPSGIPEPSSADRRITERLVNALATVDVSVLDHLVIGQVDVVSFAERGWL